MPHDTYLARIVAAHRAAAGTDRRAQKDLLAQAEAVPPPRGFSDHIAASKGLAVIAEVKRRSPSKGDILPALDPAALGREYHDCGATCVSVLTDLEFFGGSAEDLVEVQGSCPLPVLRKDFTVCEADVFDARIMGADAVLLIAAALTDAELETFHTLARELAMDALIEVHDETELARALDIGAELVGVNQRDLRSFEVDADRASYLASSIPPEVLAVAESGIGGPEDARRLAEAGYQAVLVGESLLTSTDRSRALDCLRGHRIGSRAAPPVTAGAQRRARG